MPNWCYNRVEITHPNIQEIVDLLKSDETAFDLDKVVPMPPILRTTTSGRREFEIDGQKVVLDSWFMPSTGDLKADHAAARPFTPEEAAEIQETGYRSWYDWSIANWGTKWNTGRADVEIVGDDYVQYHFHTAWSPPEPVIQALRERYPEANIAAFYDEPGMCAAGYY